MELSTTAQIVISLAGNLLGAGLEMTGRKLMGVAVIVLSMGMLWWAIAPMMADKGLIDTQSLPLWIGGGWTALIIIGALWAWAIVRFTPATTPGIHISATQRSKEVTGNSNIVNSNVVNSSIVHHNYPPPEKSQKIEPSTHFPILSVETQNAMVVSLRDVLSSYGRHLRVTVEPKTEPSYSFAHTLAGIFKSAGWETVFRDPLKSGCSFQPDTMNKGIGILGNNNELVKTVSGILEGAGCAKIPTVAQVFQTPTPGTPLPQPRLVQNAISIEVSDRR